MKKVLFYIICGPLAIIAFILNLVWSSVILAMRPIYKLFKYEDDWNYGCQRNKENIINFWNVFKF